MHSEAVQLADETGRRVAPSSHPATDFGTTATVNQKLRRVFYWPGEWRVVTSSHPASDPGTTAIVNQKLRRVFTCGRGIEKMRRVRFENAHKKARVCGLSIL